MQAIGRKCRPRAALQLDRRRVKGEDTLVAMTYEPLAEVSKVVCSINVVGFYICSTSESIL